MIKRITLTILTTCLLICQVNAQEQTKSKGHGGLGYTGIDYIAGYEYQNYHTLELGIAYGTRGDELGSLFYGNVHLCGEVLFNNGSNIYALKPGISATCAFLTLAGQVIYFTDFDKSTVAFRPEIGLSLLGFIDLNIGRNIVFNQSYPLNVSSTVFVVRFTLGRASRQIL